MYAISGITGKVGGALAQSLLQSGKRVRALVRDKMKAQTWEDQGCELVTATMEDSGALTKAFTGAEAVFILPPSEFDPTDGFPEALVVIRAVKQALEVARPKRVVCLSTIGAQASKTNLLTQRTLMEQALSRLAMPVTFLRPAWFMENFSQDVQSARDEGVIYSFLQPLDKPFPMVATADVGRVAAELMQEDWSGHRWVELEARRRFTPEEVSATFTRILGRTVIAKSVPRDTWHDLFMSQGMRNPEPRIQMLDGFNSGWIEFEGAPSSVRKGLFDLETVLNDLVKDGD